METRKLKQIELHRKLVSAHRLRYYQDPGSVRFYHYWNACMLRYLPSDKRLRVLDCGAGMGHLLAQAMAAGHEGWAFDLSAELLTAAETKVKTEAGLVRADGEYLPFKQNSFDAALCRGLLHHMDNWETAVREIYRVIRPGGRFVISEPCDQNPVIRTARRLLYLGSSHFDHEDHGYAREQLTARFTALGFRQLAMQNFGYVAYTVAGFPDIVPAMKRFNHAPQIVEALCKFDDILSRLPGIRRFSLHLLACFEKPE